MTAKEFLVMVERLKTLEADAIYARKQTRGAERDRRTAEAMAYRDRRDALTERVLGTDYGARLARDTAAEADELLLRYEA